MMGRNWDLSILSSFVVFSLIMSIAEHAAAQQVDEKNGAIHYEGPLQTTKKISCKLDVPNVVQNGRVFRFQMNYSPFISGTWNETFTFYWPSGLDYFDELTIRQKSFEGFIPVSGSFEDAIVPTATGVVGTGFVMAVVSGPLGPVCTAFKVIRVQSP